MLGLLATLALGASPGVVLFDAGEKRWLVMSRTGELVKLVSEPGGLRHVTDVAVSGDGKKWGVISADQLYVWQDEWPAPREVPRSGDVLKTPAFNWDGSWLYFIQNDYETMKRAKAPMRYSQVWRVRPQGGTPEKVTNSAGCHNWPVPFPGGGALVTHATCVGGRGIDLLSATGKEQQLRPPDTENGEATSAESGERIAFIRDASGYLSLFELNLKTHEERLWARLPWRAARLRPAWSADGKSIWIQNEEAIWRVTRDGSTVQHMPFNNLRSAP